MGKFKEERKVKFLRRTQLDDFVSFRLPQKKYPMIPTRYFQMGAREEFVEVRGERIHVFQVEARGRIEYKLLINYRHVRSIPDDIWGLDKLEFVTYLNLSGNSIRKIEGL
ncbi:MAG: hypothetical protein ACTSUE_08955, partial [Promethearchaeota archaeon]